MDAKLDIHSQPDLVTSNIQNQLLNNYLFNPAPLATDIFCDPIGISKITTSFINRHFYKQFVVIHEHSGNVPH